MFLLEGRVSLVPCPFWGVGRVSIGRTTSTPPERTTIPPRERATTRSNRIWLRQEGGKHPTGMLGFFLHIFTLLKWIALKKNIVSDIAFFWYVNEPNNFLSSLFLLMPGGLCKNCYIFRPFSTPTKPKTFNIFLIFTYLPGNKIFLTWPINFFVIVDLLFFFVFFVN